MLASSKGKTRARPPRSGRSARQTRGNQGCAVIKRLYAHTKRGAALLPYPALSFDGLMV